jgi:hypothetical protein
VDLEEDLEPPKFIIKKQKYEFWKWKLESFMRIKNEIMFAQIPCGYILLVFC